MYVQVVETQQQLVAEAAQYYSQWCNPVVRGVYARDNIRIQEALEAAHKALAVQCPNPDVREIISFQLAFLEFQSVAWRHEGEGKAAAYQRALGLLAVPSGNPAGEGMRARVLIQLRSVGERDKLDSFPAEDFAELFDKVPEELRQMEFWFHVARWAFAHKALPYLEQALEHFTINSNGYMSDFAWQRVNLMHLLLTGRANRVDVEQMISRTRILAHFEELERSLWPDLLSAGLVDERLAERWAQLRGELANAGPQVPRREIPTQRVRTGL